MADGIYFDGIEPLTAKLTQNMNLDAVKTVVKMNGSQLQQKAMQNAPVDTGNLKRSITLTFEDGGLTARIKATAEYAPYVEWGTRFMNAQPYIRPAYDTQKGKFKSDLQKLTR